MSKSTPADYLSRIIRRRDFLFERVTANKERDLSYDKAELSALEWAIPILMAYVSRKEHDDSSLHTENKT